MTKSIFHGGNEDEFNPLLYYHVIEMTFANYGRKKKCR